MNSQTSTTPTRLHSVPDLMPFIDEGWIGEPLYELKSGKEATAWCCTGGPVSGMPLVVAKFYRPVEQRGFRNDAVYQAGRWDAADRRTKLAVERKTRVGQQMRFSSWVQHEFDALRAVQSFGCRVPQAITQQGDIVLLEFIGDEDGPAQQLKDVRLTRDSALQHFTDLLQNVERILAAGLVHGDLSAYNILYWQNQLVIIDFPQAVDADANPNALDLLERDLANVCSYFERCGVKADPGRIANDMWTRWRFGELRV